MTQTTRTILIADSGATKTDWCLTVDGIIQQRFKSKGITPVFQSGEEIAREIGLSVYPALATKAIDIIAFYGSGCLPENSATVGNALAARFPKAVIKVYSDLIAVAYVLCGHTAGIACILGTGSNSCEWNGREVVHHVPPLGFILGDEGSGASLGKALVGDILKKRLPAEISARFFERYNLTRAQIIDKVYRQPFPSRFLASFAPFLLEHIGEESISLIVVKGFTDFFERNVMQYHYRDYPIHLTGSIAWHFAGILKETAEKLGIKIGKIVPAPMEGLIAYHHTFPETTEQKTF